jgi:hypothetical protein
MGTIASTAGENPTGAVTVSKQSSATVTGMKNGSQCTEGFGSDLGVPTA